jgi:starch-binding outer membrane protein, SusD/RagB family
VPVQNTQSFGFNGVSFPFMNEVKYPVAASNIDVADGIEAKLIIAEAALQSGAYATEKANLDSARGQFGPPVFGTVGAIPIDSVSGADGNNPTLTFFRERAMDLFLTAHRLSDLRRLVRQYGFTQAQVFPTGVDPVTGGNYGSDVTFPGSSDEANNPLYHGCFNRNP